MIRTEQIDINGMAFIRTYSDANRYVVRDGASYSEALDPAGFERTYTEGDPIDISDSDYAEVGKVLMGVEE